MALFFLSLRKHGVAENRHAVYDIVDRVDVVLFQECIPWLGDYGQGLNTNDCNIELASLRNFIIVIVLRNMCSYRPIHEIIIQTSATKSFHMD